MTVKYGKTKYNKTGKSPHIGAGQGNPIGGKESQEQVKESEIHLLPLVGVPEK